MALLDIFKKKDGKKEVKIKEKKERKKPLEAVKIPKEKKEEVKQAPVQVSAPLKKKKSEKAWRVLSAPHITEKATFLAEKNQYVFKISPDANKKDVKKAVEDLYGVKVIKANIINIPKKQRRLGRQTGWRKGYKKAIVKIEKGQKIEIISH